MAKGGQRDSGTTRDHHWMGRGQKEGTLEEVALKRGQFEIETPQPRQRSLAARACCCLSGLFRRRHEPLLSLDDGPDVMSDERYRPL